MVYLDLNKDSSRISDHPSTWDYVICRPELQTKRDVYHQIKRLTEIYGTPLDSVGTIRRYQDSKTKTTLMFAVIVDATKEVFPYSQAEADKLQNPEVL